MKSPSITTLQRAHGALVAMCAATLAACAVGPDYSRPSVVASAGYSSTALPVTTVSAPVTGGAAQRFVDTQEIRADWWTLFRSRDLDALIERAFAANPTVEAAQAALRIAEETAAAQRGFFYPTVGANYVPTRTKIAGNQGGNAPGIQGDGSVISTRQGTPARDGGTAPFNGPVTYNFHTAQVQVGFVPDVFGANRRLVEALEAQATVQKFQLEATYVTLASNVAAAAIQEALLRREIRTAQDIVDANAQAVSLIRRQVSAGYASRLDLLQQESALAQAQQMLPPLHRQFEQTRNVLRALAGNAQDVKLPESFDLDSLVLPEELPLSLPSRLVEQRPDVRAAEAQVHAASALVGVATANRLPQFSIDASWGGAASRFSQLFLPSGLFFNVAGNLAQPLFDGGTLGHRQRAAEEGLRQATAQYRATVITAFQNVADVLQAIHADADELQASLEAERTTRGTLELVRRRLVRGYVDRLALLTAEQVHHQAVFALAQARAARLGDTVALFQALGGGWWTKTATQDAQNGTTR